VRALEFEKLIFIYASIRDFRQFIIYPPSE